MSPIEAALLVALLVLPFHLLVQYQLGRLEDPRYLRRHGIVVVQASAIEVHGATIGTYRGCEIWDSVVVAGLRYRFDHVVPPETAERTGPGELFLEPGLLYVLA